MTIVGTCDRREETVRFDKGSHRLAGGQFPESSGPVDTAGDEPAAVAACCQGRDDARVTTKFGPGSAVGKIPRAGAQFSSSSDEQLAVGGDGGDLDGSGCKPVRWLAKLCVPDADIPVNTAGDEPLGVTARCGHDCWHEVALELRRLPAGIDIPKAADAIEATLGYEFAVGADGECGGRYFVLVAQDPRLLACGDLPEDRRLTVDVA